MFAQQLVYTIRILQRKVVVDFFGRRRQGRRNAGLPGCHPVAVSGRRAGAGIVPGGAVVALFLFVKARENAIGVRRQLEIAPDDKRSVGVVEQVVLGDAVVL